ncbi:transcriptional regulator [uncultured Vagococcus sp.]|uniref:helix-turn-helix domain-containing protein n=1 Tax=uncultured Vagococcus sp. TaxID=189676 RepID=UPI0028D7E511|nr:transcriptional regulator [uncultured Vagococcus sp.]
MKEESFITLLKQEPLQIEVGRLIKDMRVQKHLSQGDLCQLTHTSRQQLSKIENGRIGQLNLEKVRQLINACGEQLHITTSFDNPLQISDRTEREDAVLIAFAAGEIKKAEELLQVIRRWNYPPSYITAQCKRNVGIAVSYHFMGMEDRSKLRMSDLVMGLCYLGCDKEADRFIDIYDRTISSGEKGLMAKEEAMIKKGAV